MMCSITGSIHFAAATPSVNSTFFVQNYWSCTGTKVTGMNWALWFECVYEKTRFEQREATAKRLLSIKEWCCVCFCFRKFGKGIIMCNIK